MYFIPSFVKETYKNDNLYLSSPLYENTIKLDSKYIQEYLNVKKNGTVTLNNELTSFLHAQSMMFTQKELENELVEIKEKLSHSLLLTIMPTEACNFRCSYCYENHKNLTMSVGMVEKIKTFITQKLQTNKFSHLGISWFGGEPTLCSDYIFDLNSFVLKNIANTDVNFTSSITTNGYLLNMNLFKNYYANYVRSFQITLDGWDHDKTRPLASGKGSLKVILDNLKEISKLPSSYDFSIMIRHNILDGDQDYSWYDYLKELFGNDRRFSILVRPVNDMGGETVKQLKLVKNNDLVKRHADYVSSIGMTCKNKTMDFSVKPGQKVCYAALPNAYVFRADGRIHKCTVDLDFPLNCVGVIDEQYGVKIDEEKNKMWYEEEPQAKCYNCIELLSCLNKGCPRNRLIKHYYCSCSKI